MLDAIRQRRRLIQVVLWVVVIVFVAFYAGNFADVGGNDPQNNVASVSKEPITLAEYQNMVDVIRQQQQQFMPENQEMNPQMLAFFRQQALNTLVDRKLMLLEGRKAGMKASEEEIKRAILNSPYFNNNGSFVGMQEYKQRVDMLFHMDISAFEQMVAEDIIVRKFNDVLTAGILVTDGEIEERYRKSNLTAKIDYVTFNTAEFEKELQLTPEELRAYYDSHKKEFETGEQRKVQYLWISHQSDKNKVQVTEQELKEYFDQNQQRYSRPEQVHARHILLNAEGKDDATVRGQAEDLVKQLRGGADFAELAKNHSEDPGSKENGGDLGFFERGRMVAEFDEAAFSLPVNQISDPIKTQFGYHIIEVLEKRPASKMEFAMVKDQIYRMLSTPRAIKNAEEQANNIYKEVKEKKKSFNEVSRLQLVELRNTEYFSRDEDLPALSPAFREKAFELKKGEVSEPVQVYQDFAILQLAETKPSEVPPFEKIDAKVREKVRQQKLEQLARQKANEFQSQAASSDLKTAAEKAKLEVKSTDPFTSEGYISDIGNAPEVSKKAFSMNVGELSEPVKTEQGFVVFKLTERKDFDKAELEKEKDRLRQGALQEKQSAFLQAYRAQLRKKYEEEIWINQDVVSPKEA